jgi:hypothetical protein
MKNHFKVKKFDHIRNIYDIHKPKKLLATLQGYAFIHENGHCMIICYGEGQRDYMIELFNSKNI